MQKLLHRMSRGVEVIAAICLAVVTVIIFASAIGRYAFATPIPDNFDISRLLLGVALMWGLAVINFRGGHIAVDLAVNLMPPRPRRAVELLAQLVLLGATVVMAWKMFSRVETTFRVGEATFDLRLPVWPLIGLIWLGVAAAALTAAARFVLMLTNSESRDQGEEDHPLE